MELSLQSAALSDRYVKLSGDPVRERDSSEFLSALKIGRRSRWKPLNHARSFPNLDAVAVDQAATRLARLIICEHTQDVGPLYGSRRAKEEHPIGYLTRSGCRWIVI